MFFAAATARRVMHARLHSVDPRSWLTGKSSFYSPLPTVAGCGNTSGARVKTPLCFRVKCQRRPEPRQPAWRQRTDQVAEQLSHWVNIASQKFDQAVMPRERGDVRDQTLMALSLAVLVLFSMQLFRLYMHVYNAAGLRPIKDMLRH